MRSGRLAVPTSGLYGLAIKAIGGASLSIDGETVIEMTEPGQFTPVEKDLIDGVHDIEVRFVDDTSHSQVHLYWRLPDGNLERIPPEALLLPLDGAWRPVEP